MIARAAFAALMVFFLGSIVKADSGRSILGPVHIEDYVGRVINARRQFRGIMYKLEPSALLMVMQDFGIENVPILQSRPKIYFQFIPPASDQIVNVYNDVSASSWTSWPKYDRCSKVSIGLKMRFYVLVFWQDLGSEITAKLLSGGQAHILACEEEPVFGDARIVRRALEVRDGAETFRKNESSQLLLSSLFRTSNQIDSGDPKHPRDNAEEPFTRLDSKNRNLSSLLTAVLALLLATVIYLGGWSVLGAVLAAYAIFGLPLRIDIWSLIERIF